MAMQGGVIPVMNSADELVLDVNINLTHIPYPKYLGMELGRVGEGQESQPGVNTGQVAFAGEARRNHEPQFVMVVLTTSVMPYPAPKRFAGFKDLGGCLTGWAKRAYRVIHHEFKGKVAPNQRKPKTERSIGIRNHSTTKRVQEAATEENMEECTAISHC